jgi:hypothetical protein
MSKSIWEKGDIVYHPTFKLGNDTGKIFIMMEAPGWGGEGGYSILTILTTAFVRIGPATTNLREQKKQQKKQDAIPAFLTANVGSIFALQTTDGVHCASHIRLTRSCRMEHDKLDLELKGKLRAESFEDLHSTLRTIILNAEGKQLARTDQDPNAISRKIIHREFDVDGYRNSSILFSRISNSADLGWESSNFSTHWTK